MEIPSLRSLYGPMTTEILITNSISDLRRDPLDIHQLSAISVVFISLVFLKIFSTIS
jgi:hypothetical protein